MVKNLHQLLEKALKDKKVYWNDDMDGKMSGDVIGVEGGQLLIQPHRTSLNGYDKAPVAISFQRITLGKYEPIILNDERE